MASTLPGPRTVSQLKRSVLHPSTTSNYICRFQPPNNADSFLNARLGSGYYSGDQQEKLEISCVEASLPTGASLLTEKYMMIEQTYDIDNAFPINNGVTENIFVCLWYPSRNILYKVFNIYINDDRTVSQLKTFNFYCRGSGYYYIVKFFENWLFMESYCR